MALSRKQGKSRADLLIIIHQAADVASLKWYLPCRINSPEASSEIHLLVQSAS